MDELVLPVGALAGMRRAIENAAPSEATRALREAGRHLAADAEAALADSAASSASDLTLEEFWHNLARYFEDCGWGSLSHERLGDGLGAAVATDWAESDPSEGRDIPGCHISTGLMAELLTRIAGEPVAVLEASCRSRGDDACRFLFGSPSTLLGLHRQLARGRTLDEALATVT